jgi:hypothetical protein
MLSIEKSKKHLNLWMPDNHDPPNSKLNLERKNSNESNYVSTIWITR